MSYLLLIGVGYSKRKYLPVKIMTVNYSNIVVIKHPRSRVVAHNF